MYIHIYITKTQPCQYTETFKVVKIENVQYKIFLIFFLLLLKTKIVDTRQYGSNEYPQPMFCIPHSFSAI